MSIRVGTFGTAQAALDAWLDQSEEQEQETVQECMTEVRKVIEANKTSRLGCTIGLALALLAATEATEQEEEGKAALREQEDN